MFMVATCAREFLDEEAREEISDFLVGRFNPDGGARGRNSTSDLYYTMFTAGALQVLGESRPSLKTLSYIRSFRAGSSLDFTHRVCLARLRSAIPSKGLTRGKILKGLEAYRSGDGGYHHQRKGADTGTIYGAFIALLAYEDLGRPLPRPDDLRASVKALHSEDANTMNLAAAVCLMQQLGGVVHPDTRAWFESRRSPHGGYRAHPEAPVDDLLSTATALFALRLLGADLAPVRESCFKLVESCWQTGGGFGGHEADTMADSEYTFYALLSIGCLMA